MKTVAAIAILCLGAAAARKPSRETASDRIEKLLAARGSKSADRRWATAVNTLKSKTRRLSGDDDGGDDDYVPNCPTQYDAYMTCLQGLMNDGTVTGDDDYFAGGDDDDDDGDDDDGCGPSNCDEATAYVYGVCSSLSLIHI